MATDPDLNATDSQPPECAASARFFSFDGIDGVGKSTQIERFVGWLREGGREVVACRDPGSTPLGEAVRDILLHREEIPLASRAEMLLYMAARAQLVAEVIQPALAAGKTVVCDRYLLANVVYQGHAGGLDVDQLWQVGRIATANVEPALTFVLDMDSDAAAARLTGAADRLEKRGGDYRRRLRAGYLAEADRNERIVVIDAGGSIEEVAEQIRTQVAGG
ncbi:MAG: dTMP kinase, partial [Pirellulales bacterium]